MKKRTRRRRKTLPLRTFQMTSTPTLIPMMKKRLMRARRSLKKLGIRKGPGMEAP